MRGPLDGHEFSRRWMTLYCIPGRAWLWIRYMFPGGGFAGVAASGRQAHSPLMAILYSTLFYLIAAVLLIVAILS